MDIITTALANATGITKNQLTRLAQSGRLHHLVHGGYGPGRSPEALAVRAQIVAAVTGPTGTVCRRTAAWLWGLDVLPPGRKSHDWPVEVLVAAGERMPIRRPGCAGLQADLPGADVTTLGGVNVTTQLRTALDCARYLPRLEAVAALDQFLRRGVRPDSLRQRAGELAGRRNAKRLREALALGDAGAESPGESWTRVLVVDSGLPRPATQVPVVLAGDLTVFVDLGYPDFRVGVEYDGEKYHSAAADRAHDRWRRGLLAAEGWKIVVVRRSEVLGYPAAFLEDLAGKLINRGWRPTREDSDRFQAYLRMLGNREERWRRYAA